MSDMYAESEGDPTLVALAGTQAAGRVASQTAGAISGATIMGTVCFPLGKVAVACGAAGGAVGGFIAGEAYDGVVWVVSGISNKVSN